MSAEDSARRFDNRAGYQLVSYGPVGLPVYRIIAVGLCLLRKPLDPIEEFILRSVASGLGNSREIAGLLGLLESVVDICLVELIRSDSVRIVHDSGGLERFVLTAKGAELVREQEAVIPIEQTIVFCYDGLTRKPRICPDSILLKPKQLKDEGIPEIPAFPARPPELEEVALQDVIHVLKLEEGRDESPKQLLKITSIERRDRVFIEAVALAFRAEEGKEIQVGFAIDGRQSVEHEQAFSRARGIEKTKLFHGLRDQVQAPSMEQVVGHRLSTRISAISEEEMLRDKSVSIRPELFTIDGKQSPKIEVGKSQESIREDSSSVRPLSVYEHAPLLWDALETASSRVLVVSPWIRKAVVNGSFLSAIRKAIGRGVTIYIGYGLGDDGEEKTWDKQARLELEKISLASRLLQIRRLGDTHAKVLIKDSEYFVISSFNWLSFKGDPNHTFREEWGTIVSVPEVVRDYFDEMLQRFGED